MHPSIDPLGDVARPRPITVEWSTYTQSLTEKPVKGVLTGPGTILAWSFVRDDQPLRDTANQVALTLRCETQIHTHLRYSEFGIVIDAIDNLDADVTSIEAARSKMEVVPEIKRSGIGRGTGPCAHDIDSPRIPSVEEVTELIEIRSDRFPSARSGSTRAAGSKPEDTVASLKNLLAATRAERATVSLVQKRR